MKIKKEEKTILQHTAKNSKGVTLVALVVTIIVLLILAGVTITSLLGDDGIIKKAGEAANKMNEAIQNEQSELNALIEELNSIMAGNGGSETPEEPEIPTGPNGKPLLSTVTEIQYDKNIEAEDSHGNIVMVPAGFKVVEGSNGEEITVQNGVVIEDSAGNQFVWIPVGVVTKNDGTKSNEIKLGRYTFSTSSPGTPTEVQLAYTNENPTNYLNIVTIIIDNVNYQELTTPRDGIASSGTNGLNATAKNLGAFVQSVKDNGGYYLARYEASYGSGSSVSDWKPLSQPSTANSTSSMNYVSGTLWNFITQLDAAKVARNMYAGNKDMHGNNVGVESDLVNSYAWDTAIVYIQEMEHADYANKKDGNGTLYNTGPNGVGDVVCNIYDMVANEYEWTTEYSAHKDSSRAYPCVGRGGHYRNSTYYMACRNLSNATISDNFISFRPVLYVQ